MNTSIKLSPWKVKGFALLPKKIIITFGTFDLFHIGHLNILKRCKKYGNKLIVGVSTDKLNFEKKNKLPISDQKARKEIIESLKIVDEVFFEESLEKKKEYISKYKADILIMGDDHKGKFDFCKDICEVIYLPRTPSISTTSIIEKIST
uniref:Cytidylyltransferase n=1 Tax=Mimivirus LCMiAC02 TaxID=2506609 RepID=A0A481Z131_9VIRU|nr:MAG: cytidylyltransferase [Mimivirus LCMiAC02]